jgi:hypothetical protein
MNDGLALTGPRTTTSHLSEDDHKEVVDVD